jgi:hypothetical protein
MHQAPHYVYPFRRHSEQEGIQAEVVLIRSLVPLDQSRMLEQLGFLVDHPVQQYRLIDAADDVSLKLDTWEPAIEFSAPVACSNAVEVLRQFDAGGGDAVFVPCEAAAEYMAGSALVEPASAD